MGRRFALRFGFVLVTLGLWAAPARSGETISWEANAHYVATGKAGFTHAQGGDVWSQDTGLLLVSSLQARSDLLIRFGLEVQRWEFDAPAGALIPSCLQSMALIAGADLQLGEAWLVRLEIQPGFYGDSGWHSRDFNVPLMIGASYFVSADLQWVAGISLDVKRQYPILPGVGVRWRFATGWTLNAILPAPRLEYEISSALTVYAGADLRGGTYHVGDLLHSSRVNHHTVEYTQIRLGGGAVWKARQDLTFQLEAGCVPVNTFNYERADLRAKSREVAPYAGFQVRADF